MVEEVSHLTAAEASRNTDLRARVGLAVRTSQRTIVDLLNGFEGQSTLAARIRAALSSEGVDLATIPRRTSAEVLAWKRRRQRCKACEDKDVEIAELRRHLAALRGQAPTKVSGSPRSGLACVPCDDSGIEIKTEGKASP